MDFLYFLQELRNPVLNNIFTFITYFGDELLLIGILSVSFWCINKKLAYKLGFSFLISGFFVQTFKIIFRINRPWLRDSRLKVAKTAESTATGYSFPSGHTQSSTSLFSTIALNYKKVWLSIICFIIVILVMLSRMFLGCHTPADVLTSFGITIVISLFIDFFSENYELTDALRLVIMLVFLLLSAGLIVYGYYLINSGKSTIELTLDAFKSAGVGIGFSLGWFIEEKWIKYNPKSIDGVWQQILKFIIGLAITLGLKTGIKVLFGTSIPVSIIRYFIVTIWAVAGYPAILRKISR